MPDGGEFLPEPKAAKGKWSKGWFGSGRDEEDEEREAERVRGKVQKTRRMRRDEGQEWGGVPVGVDERTRTGPSGVTRSQRAGQEPVAEGLD